MLLCVAFISVKPAAADEGGISFWIPGFFGSLAATPQQPGFSFAGIYYHTSVSAGGNVAFARQVTRGNITANFSGSLTANLDAKADLVMAAPSYVFATPVLGGQAAVRLLVPYGRSRGICRCNIDRPAGPHRLYNIGQRERFSDRLRRFGAAI